MLWEAEEVVEVNLQQEVVVIPSKYKYGCCGVGGEWEIPWRESSGV